MMALAGALSSAALPACAAEGPELAQGPPPVSQPLVNEGTFAIELANALAVAVNVDEIEAETRLGTLHIAPKNGWIAEYPVTPDVLMELQQAVLDAAVAKKLAMGKEEALSRFNDVAAGFGLRVKPYVMGTAYAPSGESCATYPNPALVKTTYTDEGPPVVTYYCPPPDYYYLYAWVPSPFWWSDLWFPGFFVLHDFHRVIHRHKRVEVITNHFRDRKSERGFRIDPVQRYAGKTYAGIGANQRQIFLPTGISRGERTIFNNPRQEPPHREMIGPTPRSGEGSRSREDEFSAPGRGGSGLSGGNRMERGPRR